MTTSACILGKFVVVFGREYIGLFAEQAGISPEMIKKHYRRPLTLEESEAWFKILPQHGMGEQSEVA